MSEYQLIASGYFTSDGTTKEITLRSDFDRFEVLNKTQAATVQATGRGCEFKWQRGMGAGEAFMYTKQNASNALDLEYLTSGGFTRVDKASQAIGAQKQLASTYVTQANPAVVTCNAHGYSNGDRVRLYGTTSMLQIAGYDFTIASVTTNTFTLAYLDSSGFAAAATAGYVRKLPKDPKFAPQANRITGITAANPMVVTLAVTHGLAVGETVKLHVASAFGMSEADGLVGEITAVSTANNTISLDIDASAFTAFAFPTSAVAARGVTPAHIVPVGDVGNVLDGATLAQEEIVMELPSGEDSPGGSSSDLMYWQAFKAAYVNNES